MTSTHLRHLPDTLRHHPDTLRQHPDTQQTPSYLACMRPLGERGISEYHDIYSTVLNLYDIYHHIHLPDTLRHHPDNARHPQTPYRHPSDTPIFGLHLFPNLVHMLILHHLNDVHLHLYLYLHHCHHIHQHIILILLPNHVSDFICKFPGDISLAKSKVASSSIDDQPKV